MHRISPSLTVSTDSGYLQCHIRTHFVSINERIVKDNVNPISGFRKVQSLPKNLGSLCKIWKRSFSDKLLYS